MRAPQNLQRYLLAQSAPAQQSLDEELQFLLMEQATLWLLELAQWQQLLVVALSLQTLH